MTDIAFTCMNDAHISERHTEANKGLLAQIQARLELWRDRTRSRAALAQLSAYDLKDIGLSQSQAVFEINKPFWSA